MIDAIAAGLFLLVLGGFFVMLCRPRRSSDIPRDVSDVKPAAAPVCGPACWDCPTAAYGNQTPEAIPNRRELSQPGQVPATVEDSRAALPRREQVNEMAREMRVDRWIGEAEARARK